jgi:hypothetical protein
MSGHCPMAMFGHFPGMVSSCIEVAVQDGIYAQTAVKQQLNYKLTTARSSLHALVCSQMSCMQIAATCLLTAARCLFILST